MIPNKPMTLMCVQPAMAYYAWQVEVMLANFEKLKIHRHFNIHLLFAYNKTEPNWQESVSWIRKIEEKYETIASFFYYQDTREYPISYISSIRPNLLKQHFKRFPLLGQIPVFYHDSDIIFTKFPDFMFDLLEDDGVWYVSDTVSYIGYEYIVSKGEDVLNDMCSIVGINPYLVKEKQNESGGAQYLMKNVDWVMFDKMEKDCEQMFKEITELNNKKVIADPTHHPLQIWTADMWCLIWAAWLRGSTTKVIPELDFCWATDPISNFDKKFIFHNAGVTDHDKEILFYKGDFRYNLPYQVDGSKYDQNRASYKYYEIIKEIGENSALYDK